MSTEFSNAGGTLSHLAQQAQYLDAKMATAPTIQQRLNLAAARAKEQLARVEEAQAIFAKNPDLQRLLDIMQGGHF